MRNCQLVYRGMTLVELLVVVTIIGLLLAISVPLLRPVLESRKTSNAAHVFAGAFQHARAKSIQEGKSYGIRLIPFDTAPTTALQLRLQKEFNSRINPPNVRVRVVEGKIIPYYFDSANSKWQPMTDVDVDQLNKVTEHFKPGHRIQFNHIGRFFKMDDDYKLAAPYDKLNLPDPDNPMDGAMEYQISAIPTSTLIPQTVMPRGTIVDLAFSGGETVNFSGGNKTPDNIPPSFSSGDEVVVMFSPAGHVDKLYINGTPKEVNETLYFCIGEWDRQVDTNGNSLAEDKKSNLDVPATYWVALHPKTGKIHIAENAPAKSDNLLEKLRDARKFVREHFFNIGN